ncbi:hypothetical protein GBZ48_31500 [Azospirillum melinis]|uniref:DUF302 domain-containing protein n=1 Tax=Azospirillum melinis TaxID=328839 RepID=A0ABX2KPN3_9PROT|nr:hypothetical protein [Azospirillum melinis]MBP2310497.1 hypothetical protein [Azospirillum melinis]NUB03743.1 hypothetical protein [Azospirillum melinis]
MDNQSTPLAAQTATDAPKRADRLNCLRLAVDIATINRHGSSFEVASVESVLRDAEAMYRFIEFGGVTHAVVIGECGPELKAAMAAATPGTLTLLQSEPAPDASVTIERRGDRFSVFSPMGAINGIPQAMGQAFRPDETPEQCLQGALDFARERLTAS